MTLEEAIKHEEEIVKEEQYEYQECVATHNMEGAMNCRKYAEEHRQLAEWLKDYKRLLEQEPCNDAISRQAIQEIIDSPYTYCSQKLDAIIKLPPVTPTRPRGKWINGDAKCPCCGKSKFEGLDADIWADWKPKYCPNCGADMRGNG